MRQLRQAHPQRTYLPILVLTAEVSTEFLEQHHGLTLDGDAAQCLRYIVEGSARAYDLIGELLAVAEAAATPRADAPR
jgi:hypothetical protein